jgi:hypothetical protein
VGPSVALRAAICLRARLRGAVEGARRGDAPDARIAVGIGTVESLPGQGRSMGGRGWRVSSLESQTSHLQWRAQGSRRHGRLGPVVFDLPRRLVNGRAITWPRDRLAGLPGSLEPSLPGLLDLLQFQIIPLRTMCKGTRWVEQLRHGRVLGVPGHLRIGCLQSTWRSARSAQPKHRLLANLVRTSQLD